MTDESLSEELERLDKDYFKVGNPEGRKMLRLVNPLIKEAVRKLKETVEKGSSRQNLFTEPKAFLLKKIDKIFGDKLIDNPLNPSMDTSKEPFEDKEPEDGVKIQSKISGSDNICEFCGKRKWFHNKNNIHNKCKQFKPRK